MSWMGKGEAAAPPGPIHPFDPFAGSAHSPPRLLHSFFFLFILSGSMDHQEATKSSPNPPPIQKWPSCANLPRAGLAFSPVRPATLGVPLTRSLSISGPANLAWTLGQHSPSWAFYHYRSPNYRSGWPYRMFADRFECDRILYDKHFSVTPIYRNVPTGVPAHRTNFSNHQQVGYWSFDYDYLHELPPKPLFSVLDPFDGPYRNWNKYGNKWMDETLNRKCYYHNKRHYFM